MKRPTKTYTSDQMIHGTLGCSGAFLSLMLVIVFPLAIIPLLLSGSAVSMLTIRQYWHAKFDHFMP